MTTIDSNTRPGLRCPDAQSHPTLTGRSPVSDMLQLAVAVVL